MYKLALMAVSVVAVSGKPEVHRLVKVQDGIDIPQDIVYDEKEQTVLITVAPVPELNRFVPTVNFHDYRTGFVAFKDVNATKCYLSYPPIRKPTPDVYRMKRTDKLVLSYVSYLDENAMTPAKVQEKAGGRIREFCNDYDTHWMSLRRGFPDRVKRSVASSSIAVIDVCPIWDYENDVSVRTHVWLGCGICAICSG